jgi:hypothetical protein
MAAEQLKLTERAIVEAVVVGKAKTISKAAELAGVHRHTAADILQKGTVQRAIEKAKAPKRDKARSTAAKALDRADSALDYLEDDPLRVVQAALGAINVAKVHAESFATEESPELHADNQRGLSLLLTATRADGLRIAAWLLRRGWTLDQLTEYASKLPR